MRDAPYDDANRSPRFRLIRARAEGTTLFEAEFLAPVEAWFRAHSRRDWQYILLDHRSLVPIPTDWLR